MQGFLSFLSRLCHKIRRRLSVRLWYNQPPSSSFGLLMILKSPRNAPDLQIPDKGRDLPLSFELDPAPTSRARSPPDVFSCASSNTNLGSSLSILHPWSRIGEMKERLITEGGSRIRLGPRPQKRSKAPSRPFAPACPAPAWHTPPLPHFLLNPYSRWVITRPPRSSAHLSQGMLGDDTTRDRHAEATQEGSQRNGRRLLHLEPRAGPGPQHRRAEPNTIPRSHSFPSCRGAGTHQQVGAAIISLRHRRRGAASVSASRPPAQTSSDTRSYGDPSATAPPPQAAYIGRSPFPTGPAKLAPHWACRAQASGEPDQLLPRAWLEIEVKGERGRAGPRGRGQRMTNQRPGDVR